jgi:hypothetical protein
MKQETISEFYDHVVKVTETQKRLIPFADIYGDGSRWQNKLSSCMTTYQVIRQILFQNGLIDSEYKLKA